MTEPSTETTLERLGRTTEEVFSLAELRHSLATGRPLRIKYGVDVTAPFLHIGHAVNLWMMRSLQDLGHKVIFLVGDFTTRIGDPTGKAVARKVITPEEIERNAQQFIEQVAIVLQTDLAVFEVRRNSEWYDRMGLSEFLSLLSMVTHQRLIERDMFQKRIEAGHEIFMHEMIYPLLQGYDSVMLDADLTIVGSDQLFNELMGRFFQERFGQRPQVVITTKITPGTDGKEKQSKSLGNYIALADTPRDKFGKIMSIPDHLIVPYLAVYTLVPMGRVREIEESLACGQAHPMEAKMELAVAVVKRYHGQPTAESELRWFEKTFSQRRTPEDVPVVEVPAGTGIVDVLQACLPDKSRSELRRLILQGGVRIDERKVDSPEVAIENEGTLRAGKTKWFRIRVCRVDHSGG